MGNLTFFDCNCSFGRRSQVTPGTSTRLSDLLHTMARLRISSALVHHTLAREYDPATGNAALLRSIRRHPHLKPCWVLVPHHVRDMAPPNALARAMLRRGVLAARLCPREHNFSLAPWCSGELLAALAARRIPTFIDADQLGWDTAHTLCTEYPDLPLVVTAVGYRDLRLIFPLWERHENLFLATSLLAGHRQIEECVHRYGSHHLLFDTRMQAIDPGTAITAITYADVTEEQKRHIARGNIERLLNNVHQEDR